MSETKEELTFWPHLNQREVFLLGNLDRLRHLEALLETLSVAFKSIMNREKSLTKVYQRAFKSLKSHLESSSTTSGPSARLAQDSNDIISTLSDACLARQSLLAQSVVQIKSLLQDVRQTRQSLNSRTQNLLATQHKWRNSILSHLKSHTVLLKDLEIAQVRHMIKVDPWLSEQGLSKKLKIAHDLEVETRGKIRELIDDISTHASRAYQNAYTILKDRLREMTAHHASMESAFSALQFSVQGISEQSITRVGTNATLTGAEEFSSSFWPEGIRRIEVLHQGTLLLQTRFSLRKWKKVYGIITETGFLHIYPFSKNCHEHTTLHKSPLISISLSVPRVRVQVVPEKTLLSQFTLSVPKKDTSWFRWKKNEEFTGDIRRIQFRAFDQEQMISWLQILQTKIQSYLSSEPPCPIYSSAETLRQKIEEPTLQSDIEVDG